jgi:hypothetical protein
MIRKLLLMLDLPFFAKYPPTDPQDAKNAKVPILYTVEISFPFLVALPSNFLYQLRKSENVPY